MSAVIPYTIVVPSHRRVANMRHILHLFPDALICVDEREEEAYREAVPRDQLWLHPSHRDTMPRIRNWITDQAPTEAVVQIDDDLVHVLSTVWRRPRKITDPAAIRQIIENGINIAHDLGKSCYCWGRMRVSMAKNIPNLCPFAFTRLASSTFVTIGRAAPRFNDQLPFNSDIDFTLNLLLRERIVLQDTRFYINHGNIEGSDRGGLQGKRTAEGYEQWRRLMRAKWKSYVRIGRVPSVVNTGRGKWSQPSTLANRILVSRKSPLTRKRAE